MPNLFFKQINQIGSRLCKEVLAFCFSPCSPAVGCWFLRPFFPAVLQSRFFFYVLHQLQAVREGELPGGLEPREVPHVALGPAMGRVGQREWVPRSRRGGGDREGKPVKVVANSPQKKDTGKGTKTTWGENGGDLRKSRKKKRQKNMKHHGNESNVFASVFTGGSSYRVP